MTLYFDDPRFKMSHFGHLLTRIVSYTVYAVLIAAAAIFLLSDVKQLFWLGGLLALFLTDRLFHLGKAPAPPFWRSQKGGADDARINVANYLMPSSCGILERAYDKFSPPQKNFYLLVLRFLAPLPQVRNCLMRLDIRPENFQKKIDEVFAASRNDNNIHSQLETLVKAAFEEAVEANRESVEPLDLFVALAHLNDAEVNKIFDFFEIKPQDLRQAAVFSRYSRFGRRTKLMRVKIHHRIMNRAWTSRPTPTLDRFSVDLTDLASAGKIGLLIGRQNEYERLANILARPAKPNALLVGEEGVGKEALVSALALHITKDDVPELLFDKRLVLLRINDLVAGARIEEVSGRLKKMSEEIITAGNIILYVADIHNLGKISAERAASAADFLLPFIRNDAYPIIGATYPREFKIFIEPQSDFAGAFEIIRLEEISEEEAARILTYESLLLEAQYKITISVKAIRTAVELAHQYLRQTLLPQSAKDLLEETLAYVRDQKRDALTVEDVVNVVERKINVPVRRPGKAEVERLLDLEHIIHQSFIDQEAAVSAVSRSLREYRSGLSRKGGPIAVFLFVGPTGVGKTELAKILAKIQFGSEEAMVRFDMSEYQTKETISEFIGTPDGKTSGALTEAVRQKPFGLILLDEFEKAHPDLLNLFLPVFDDGRLTDSAGRVVDFTNTVIIATSNALSDFIKEQIEAGETMDNVSETIKKKLTAVFRPELLNRFSQVVVFKNLTPTDVVEITKLQLKSLAKTLEEQGIGLEYNDDAIAAIAALGYDSVFGARPLRQVISEKLRGVLAEKILKGEITRGGVAKIILEDGNLSVITV